MVTEEKIEARVKQIKAQIEETTSDYDREKAARAAGQDRRRCGGDQCRRRDGDGNEGKESPRRGRLATKAAVEEGIVPGGGTASALHQGAGYHQGCSGGAEGRLGHHPTRARRADPPDREQCRR